MENTGPEILAEHVEETSAVNKFSTGTANTMDEGLQESPLMSASNKVSYIVTETGPGADASSSAANNLERLVDKKTTFVNAAVCSPKSHQDDDKPSAESQPPPGGMISNSTDASITASNSTALSEMEIDSDVKSFCLKYRARSNY